METYDHDEYVVSPNTENDEDPERTERVEGCKSERSKIEGQCYGHCDNYVNHSNSTQAEVAGVEANVSNVQW